MSNWEYKGIYKKYNMEGIIEMPNNSKLQVCDLTVEMPEFMKQADTLFIDPPCSMGNLRTFYTKSDIECNQEFKAFFNSLFQRIDEIAPKYLFLELFKISRNLFIEECKKRYTSVVEYNATYYHSKKNTCYVIHCTNEKENTNYPELEGKDEEDIIKWICKNHNYSCIGDLCMGTGLVAKYAFDNKKQFVGTELNKKRLALVVDYIQNNQ